jgi:FecR protein
MRNIPTRPSAPVRHPNLLRRVLLAAGPAALASGTATGETTAAGYVEDVKGQVTAELSSQRRVLMPRGDVFVGDDVATAENSRAALLLGRDTSLRLGASARVRIDNFIVNAGGILTLEAGPLLLDKTSGGTVGAIKVRGSFGLITIRGTRVFVGPSNGVTGIFVVHGVITVTVRGVSFALQTGEGTDIGGRSARPTPPALWGGARIQAALASVN